MGGANSENPTGISGKPGGELDGEARWPHLDNSGKAQDTPLAGASAGTVPRSISSRGISQATIENGISPIEDRAREPTTEIERQRESREDNVAPEAITRKQRRSTKPPTPAPPKGENRPGAPEREGENRRGRLNAHREDSTAAVDKGAS